MFKIEDVNALVNALVTTKDDGHEFLPAMYATGDEVIDKAYVRSALDYYDNFTYIVQGMDEEEGDLVYSLYEMYCTDIDFSNAVVDAVYNYCRSDQSTLILLLHSGKIATT